MKYLLIISTLLLCLNSSLAQLDTSKRYFQNGTTYSEFIKDDTIPIKSTVYHLNGRTNTLTLFNKKGKLKDFYRYNKEGIKVLESHYDKNGRQLFYRYYETGKLQQKHQWTKKGEIIEEWYQTDVIKSRFEFKNGYPTYCSINTKEDSIILNSNTSCYCYNKFVIWNGENYQTRSGEIINKNYTSQLKEYHSNGTLIRKTTFTKKHQVIKEWDTLGNLKNVKKSSLEVKPFNRNLTSQEITGTPFKKKIEGGPILDSPNPLRDTIIHSYTFEKISKRSILLHTYIIRYDSLAQQKKNTITIHAIKTEVPNDLVGSNLENFIFYASSKPNDGVLIAIDPNDKNHIRFYITADNLKKRFSQSLKIY